MIFRNQLRRRWFTKAPIPVGIDRSSPLVPTYAWPIREGSGPIMHELVWGQGNWGSINNWGRDGIVQPGQGQWVQGIQGETCWAIENSGSPLKGSVWLGDEGFIAGFGSLGGLIALNQVTVMWGYRPIGPDPGVTSFSPWLTGFAGSDRFQLSMPFSSTRSNATILWDFGNVGAGYRLQTNGVDTTGYHVWATTDGGRGKELWRDAILLNSDPTIAAHSGNRSGPFAIGQPFGPFGSAEIYFLYIWDRQLSQAEITEITDNPWQIFQTDPQRVSGFAGFGGGGPPPPPNPPSCTLSAVEVIPNLTLTWTTANTPTTATLDNGIGPVNPAGGSLTIPLPAATTTYHLTVSNVNGSSVCQITVFIYARDGSAALEFVAFNGNGQYPGTEPGFGNVYTTPTDPEGNPLLLTDDDYGQIFPTYTTYFFVAHDQETGLPVGIHRRMLQYFTSLMSGTGNVTITALMNLLSNPWPIDVTLALAAQAIDDLEWGGGCATGWRMAFQFASSPLAGTDNGFELQHVMAAIKPVTHLPVRGV